jgi:hypothetical protein
MNVSRIGSFQMFASGFHTHYESVAFLIHGYFAALHCSGAIPNRPLIQCTQPISGGSSRK